MSMMKSVLIVWALCLSPLMSLAADKPNILIIWGDDIGISNISVNTRGMMGYRTPHIDRIAEEGMLFTDYYGDQSCTAGRSSFITGQSPFRTGLTKVGVPGAELGIQAKDPTIAELTVTQAGHRIIFIEALLRFGGRFDMPLK